MVAYSSGNHAQAVAYAAAAFEIDAHIVMPRETPRVKVQATRDYGAHVVLCGPGEREKVAAELLEQTGGVLIPPFDHPDVIAGQGTIGLEIADDLPDVENVLIPVSGGGLASGIGTAIKARCPNAKVFGVEPELAADAAEGLKRGERVDWSIEDRNRTIADGLRSQPSALTFAHLQTVLDGMITVSENEIRAAVRETRRQRPPGQRAERRGRAGRLPAGHDATWPNGDDPFRRQCRTVGSRRHPRGLKIVQQYFLVCWSNCHWRSKRLLWHRTFARHRVSRHGGRPRAAISLDPGSLTPDS